MNTNYIGTTLETTLEIKELVSFHYFEYVKNFEGQLEKHDFWEVLYVDNGEVIAIADKETHILKQGDIIFHKPNELHNVIIKNNFARTFIFSFVCHSPMISFFEKKVFHLDGHEKESISDFFLEGKRAFCPPYNVLNQQRLRKRSDITFGAEQLTKNSLEKVLILIIRKKLCNNQFPVISENLEQQTGDIISVVTRYLEKNINRKLSLDDIVKYTYFSKSHLEKIFHDQIQCGVMQHFLRLRINCAKRLLSEDAYSLIEIAEYLNFNSIHHFSRTFKKITGSTPSQFKNSIKIHSVL